MTSCSAGGRARSPERPSVRAGAAGSSPQRASRAGWLRSTRVDPPRPPSYSRSRPPRSVFSAISSTRPQSSSTSQGRSRRRARPHVPARSGATPRRFSPPSAASTRFSAGYEAERAGFEPATDLSARTRFPVALLRPLGHLSEPEQITPAWMKRPHGQSPGGLQAAPASGALGPLGHLSEPEQITPAWTKRPHGQSPAGLQAAPASGALATLAARKRRS